MGEEEIGQEDLIEDTKGEGTGEADSTGAANGEALIGLTGAAIGIVSIRDIRVLPRYGFFFLPPSPHLYFLHSPPPFGYYASHNYTLVGESSIKPRRARSSGLCALVFII